MDSRVREASSSPSRSADTSSSRESPVPTSAPVEADGQSVAPAAPPKPPSEVPLPAFLRQTRTEIHNSFLDLEWLQRERLSKALGATTQPSSDYSQWTRVSGDDVTKRNRYINVDPFLNNRIKLKVPEGHSDYINASPIRLPRTKGGEEKYFIATQGPKEDSYSHIWRMIWHETGDPGIIVMLTQTHESGREKCFQYFPDSLEAPTLDITEVDEFEDNFLASLTLRGVRWDDETRSTVREMELHTHEGESKIIYHFLFAGWPDFLIPEGEDKTALISLISHTAALNTAPGSPRIVHCSAGVGRSGTFIALDWLLAELEDGTLDEVPEAFDPVADVVDRLRMQRVMMVQGESQFVFLYDVLREFWKERWRKKHEKEEDAPS